MGMKNYKVFFWGGGEVLISGWWVVRLGKNRKNEVDHHPRGIQYRKQLRALLAAVQ